MQELKDKWKDSIDNKRNAIKECSDIEFYKDDEHEKYVERQVVIQREERDRKLSLHNTYIKEIREQIELHKSKWHSLEYYLLKNSVEYIKSLINEAEKMGIIMPQDIDMEISNMENNLVNKLNKESFKPLSKEVELKGKGEHHEKDF